MSLRPLVRFMQALASLCLLTLGAPFSLAQTTAFSYQGKLTDAGQPANGNYDLQFALFDLTSGGTQQGATLTRDDVVVTNGVFTVQLDFGACANCFNGAARFLELSVRPGASTGSFTLLTPRQPVQSTPYAIQSLNAATATNATNATTAVSFSGALAGDVSGTQGATTVSRLQGRNVANAAPLDGQVLKFNNTTNQWEPDTDNTSAGGGGTITGVTPGTGLSGGGASGNVTLNIANGGVGTTQLADNGVTDAKVVSVSGIKVTGTVANATNAANAMNAINATNATTAVTAANATNATNAATAVNFSGALAGDVTGNQGTTTVTRLRNLAVPTPVLADDGKVLRYKNDGVNPASFELAAVSSGAGTITGVTAGTGLTGGGTSGTVSVGLAAAGVSANELATNAVTTAKLADGSVTDAKIATVAGSKVTGTIPVAGVPAGSTNYLQNNATLTPQPSASFNISGNGTAGGTLASNLVNATTQYNLGGNRILSNPGSNNLFVGVQAGAVNSTGADNAFFGPLAGQNSTGSANSFFGVVAGFNNTGNDNSFFGRSAGFTNTTGHSNSFFGVQAGRDNSNGSLNSFFGKAAGRTNTLGSFNAFFGYEAGFTNTIGEDNSFFGGSAGRENSTGRYNSFFGKSAGGENSTGSDNSFFGNLAGYYNTTSNNNSFFGSWAGFSNTEGKDNSYFGAYAGEMNTSGNNNAFFGYLAGRRNTSLNNAFFGSSAGAMNTTGSGNAFFGKDAGVANTEGGTNAFFGHQAGSSNKIGNNNAFFGHAAGLVNGEGGGNAFFGYAAGAANTRGGANTAIGSFADVGFGNLSHATAIGADVTVTASNHVQIGRMGNSATGFNGDTVAIGGFGISSTSTHVCINVNGVFTACSSSLRYKESVQPFTQGLNLIQRLRPVTFIWKESHQPDLGLIAEEVAAVEPLLNTYNKGKIEGVKYDQLNVVLINAIKEQQTQIEMQAGLLKIQTKQLEAQQAALKHLEAQQAAFKQQQQQLDALKKLVCQTNPQAAACQE